MLMGGLDGELQAAEARRVEDHLAVCPACRAEMAAFRDLGEAADQLGREEVQVNTEAAWEQIYDRLARGLGWLLLWVGLLLMAGYGLWALGSEFMLDGDVPLAVRGGLGAFVLGCLLLLVNILRERLHRNRNERYSEVDR